MFSKPCPPLPCDKVYLLEKEKSSQELRLADRASVEVVLRSHVEHLQEELAQLQQRVRQQGPGRAARSGVREDQLRRRVEELLLTLDRLAGNSEARQAQADELIGDLKRANETLSEALDRTRRKCQARIRRMEQQQQQQQQQQAALLVAAKGPPSPSSSSSRPSLKSSIPVPWVTNSKSK